MCDARLLSSCERRVCCVYVCVVWDDVDVDQVYTYECGET